MFSDLNWVFSGRGVRSLQRVSRGMSRRCFGFRGGEPRFEIADAALIVLAKRFHIAPEGGDVVAVLSVRRGAQQRGARNEGGGRKWLGMHEICSI